VNPVRRSPVRRRLGVASLGGVDLRLVFHFSHVPCGSLSPATSVPSSGFRMPHFHCHVYPQYDGDDPYRLIDVTEGPVRLEQAAWAERLAAMQGLLERR